MATTTGNTVISPKPVASPVAFAKCQLSDAQKFAQLESCMVDSYNVNDVKSPSKADEFMRWFATTWMRWLGCGIGGVDEATLANIVTEEKIHNHVVFQQHRNVEDPLSLHELHNAYVEVNAFVNKSTGQTTGVVKMKVSARVIADVRVAVVCKQGNLVDNTLNRAVVDKCARKIMKDNNFRNDVIDVHIMHIVEQYFSATVHHEISGRSRRRVPRWLLKLMGFSEGPAVKAG
jgi:hypothetical protein